ncbi:fos-related antigen 2 isoform X3 [Cyprinus carpio]|uniref:Fos-related antigen 2 isoform X3 n=1 Tax=Cyprinus carpio TaxID=7962 RepID=A0A9Q9Z7D8_CYPCA|nr:fos-related antigen 2 isoform X3 [Cyprinus carpio]
MNATERNCISGGGISNSISQVEMQISKSPFIATVNAVPSRRELRWIIEPVMPSESLHQTSEPSANQRESFRRNIQETERLHMEQVMLQKQVSCLQREKEQLKMLLASHASICTLAQDKPHSLDTFLSGEPLPSKISITIKQEPLDDVSGSGYLAPQQMEKGSELH